MKKIPLILIPILLVGCQPSDTAESSSEETPVASSPSTTPEAEDKPVVAQPSVEKDMPEQAPVAQVPTVWKTVKRLSIVTDSGVQGIPADVVVSIAPGSTEDKIAVTYKTVTIETTKKLFS